MPPAMPRAQGRRQACSSASPLGVLQCEEATEIFALVPVKVTRLEDQWWVTELDELRARLAREASPQDRKRTRCVSSARRPIPGTRPASVRAPRRTCPRRAPSAARRTRCSAVEPMGVSLSHDGDELYVFVLEHDGARAPSAMQRHELYGRQVAGSLRRKKVAGGT